MRHRIDDTVALLRQLHSFPLIIKSTTQGTENRINVILRASMCKINQVHCNVWQYSSYIENVNVNVGFCGLSLQ